MINPLDDNSRWTVISSRFDTPQFLNAEMIRMMEEFVAGLPEDNPTRNLHQLLKDMTPEDFLSPEKEE